MALAFVLYGGGGSHIQGMLYPEKHLRGRRQCLDMELWACSLNQGRSQGKSVFKTCELFRGYTGCFPQPSQQELNHNLTKFCGVPLRCSFTIPTTFRDPFFRQLVRTRKLVCKRTLSPLFRHKVQIPRWVRVSPCDPEERWQGQPKLAHLQDTPTPSEDGADKRRRGSHSGSLEESPSKHLLPVSLLSPAASSVREGSVC